MKKITLKCKTGGFNFGDTISIGKDTIDLKTAKGLVEEGLAVEVTDVVDADKTNYAKVIADLEKTIAEKDAIIAEKDAIIVDLEAKSKDKKK